MTALKFIIITGHSGSGKSTALAAFEDSGFYCVDNIPLALLPKFLELPIEQDFETPGFAFGMDLRDKGFQSRFLQTIGELNHRGYNFKILFLEADKEVLLKRYSQTRRQHPLSRGNNLIDGISEEQTLLQEIRAKADRVIDTSHYTVHELKAVIQKIAKKDKIFIPMGVEVLSFGFKHGVPRHADLVIDVRFLVNPYFVADLKMLDGNHRAVRDYVLNDGETGKFLHKYLDLLDYLIPLYEKEGKAYLTIAVGCTGGRHRSVVIVGRVVQHLGQQKRPVKMSHRDIAR